ncbi:kinase-like domain-containing protein [Schizothecium vesticola]|uniref:Kinase-like domain-containing protein n=1 Tax=Schizothecium vesticola TaxID=314040 RepID=A0AA40ENT1_9PEZI|nr:kinase-like domain-containing protein [Schizothecium vesticola]
MGNNQSTETSPQPRPRTTPANGTPSTNVIINKITNRATASNRGASQKMDEAQEKALAAALRDTRNRLVDKLTDSPYSRMQFVTIDDVVEIFSLKTVLDLLPACYPQKEPGTYATLANRICGNEAERREEKGDKAAYDRILTILTLMEKEQMITEFIDKGLNNGQLPWKDSPLPLSESGSGWQRSDAINFSWRQWQVLAPVLGPKKDLQACHYQFPSSQPMPFTKTEGSDLKRGGYGTVNIVTVPGRAHNRFGDDSTFAVKTLEPGTLTSKDFRREVDNLNRCNHPHIVELLFSIIIGEPEDAKHLLGFPAANGTLEDLIRTPPETLTTNLYTLAKWFLVQCLGLSEGLHRIHDNDTSIASPHLAMNGEAGKDKYGIHSDIKPANILWFGRPTYPAFDRLGLGNLQLGDLGITTFHREETRSNNPHGARTNTYASPESDDPTQRNSKSRAFDIWGLGCVFLELLGYLVLQDPEFAEKFSNDRAAAGHDIFDTFYATKRESDSVDGLIMLCEPYINDAVRNCMDELLEHGACTEFVRDFVMLIRDEMLVVDRNKRYCIGEVSSRLQKMKQKGDAHKRYYTRPTPPLETPDSPRPPQFDQPEKSLAGKLPAQEETHGRHPAARVDGPVSGPPADEGQDSGQGGRRAVSVGTTSQIPSRAGNKWRRPTTALAGVASRRTKRDELAKDEEGAEWLAKGWGNDEEGARVVRYA